MEGRMVSKAIVFLLLVATCKAVPVLFNALPEVGASTQYKTEDNHGNYAFGYSEDHTSGGSFRNEAGDSLGNKVGSYGLHDADGRARVVNYVADGAGFRADVHTNEPGVDPTQDSADVTVNKALVVAAAPAVVTHTKAVVAPAVVAPAKAVVAPAPAIVSHSHLHPSVALLHSPLYSVHAPFAVGPLLVHGHRVIL
ncbi:adult-specific rigid cuticular protein 15.5-like [Argiope bruennichi]|uniref:adult-specific rigid cuticular protein 15.5-like n=1 Tax=Argiope bruennichi TaxID=94029 RepID=UPI002493E6AB|nr:adult-specific rigid cuticular protein 15.5-like [Argiope bruennichi]